MNEDSNKLCLIDNIVNWVPNTTDKEKIERIREVLQQ